MQLSFTLLMLIVYGDLKTFLAQNHTAIIYFAFNNQSNNDAFNFLEKIVKINFLARFLNCVSSREVWKATL